MQDANIIINVATDRHIKGQKRLLESLKGRFGGYYFVWNDEEEVGSPKHADNPYAFKVYAFEKALSMGYTKILWLDASVYAIKDTLPVFDVIEKEGYIMQKIKHKVGTWANDNCLEYFGLTRDEAMKMDCYGNAGFLGLNFNTPIANEFFKQWKQSAIDGSFIGEWTNKNNTESKDKRCKGHRHDLVCGSIIANRLGMKYKDEDDWLQYASPEDKVKNERIIFKAQGI